MVDCSFLSKVDLELEQPAPKKREAKARYVLNLGKRLFIFQALTSQVSQQCKEFMGKQYNKGEKRQRRVAYLKRKKTLAKKKPAPAPAA